MLCRDVIRETEFFYPGDTTRSGRRKFDVLLTSFEIMLKDANHFKACS